MDGFFTAAAPGCKRSFWCTLAARFHPEGTSRPGVPRSVVRIPPGLVVLSAAAAMLFGGCLVANQAAARLLEVGPNRMLTGPAAAAAMARDGDSIVFDPGIYRDCAIWTASRLVIEARLPAAAIRQTIMNGTIVTGPVCGDRALFEFTGNDIVVRGLIFAHARDSDHNGAGILMEGANLTVENSQFLDNENGILAGGPGGSVVRIAHSTFRGNGSCEGACAHAVYAGQQIALLEVTACMFVDTHIGHNIKSRARSTLVRDSTIEDGPTGTSSYLIDLPDGGDARILNNTLQKGALSDNAAVAISIGEAENRNSTDVLDIRGNRFVSELPEPVRFVRNITRAPARLSNNTMIGNVIPLVGAGTVE